MRNEIKAKYMRLLTLTIGDSPNPVPAMYEPMSLFGECTGKLFSDCKLVEVEGSFV